MKRLLPCTFGLLMFGAWSAAQGQRYTTEVFTNAQITITPDLIYGTNIDFLTSNLSSPMVGANAMELQSLVSNNQPIPAPYFNPGDPSTALKVTNLRYDLYQPNPAIDPENARPLVVYLHTGNALPPGINGSPNGSRKDSTVVEICKRMARRGYVVAAISYRLGWNPLAPTEEERRGQLLNAIYRALHDTRHFIRTMRKEIAETNSHELCGNRVIVLGEGTGGYIALANATLNKSAELFIEKFRPDPFNPNVSYVDTTIVGNIHGLGGLLNLYRPNGYTYESQFCTNLGGALADNSWLEDNDVPIVSFHTVFDPFAPFTQGIVIVPTTGGPVVEVNGPNTFMPRQNDFGNNAAFANFPSGDPFTDAARSRYGNTYDGVTLSNNLEGLMPFLRPRWPAPASDEASPWQFWDPNCAICGNPSPVPGVTIHQAALASNPDMSPTKARLYIDTIMGYLNPRIVAALQLNTACTFVGVEEAGLDAQVNVFPNPANDRLTVTSDAAVIRSVELFDMNGRLVRTATVNAGRATIVRDGLGSGVYHLRLRFDQGLVTRKVVLE